MAMEQAYRDFIENSSEGIWRIETDTPIPTNLSEDDQIAAIRRGAYISEANTAFARMCGVAGETAMRGIRLGTLLGPNRVAADAYLRAFIRAGYRFENITLSQTGEDGATRHWQQSLHGVVENGALVRAWGTQRDVTAQHEAEAGRRKSEDRFRALADNIPQLAWMADATGSIFWYNQRWFDYTGTTLDQMQGWGWRAVHDSAEVERVEAKFRTYILSGQPWEDTFPLRGADGTFRWFLSRAYPTRDANGKVILWCGTNTDITEQREMAAALQRAEERVRSLYELTARPDLSFDDKVHCLLQMGRKWLGMEIGLMSRIDADADLYEIVQTDAPVEGMPPGFQCALSETFCATTIRRDRQSPPLAVEDTHDAPFGSQHPAFIKFGCQSYLAAAIWTDNERGTPPWGTVAFAASLPHPRPFTEFDKDMVRLIAQWLGGELTRQQFEAALVAGAERQRKFLRDVVRSMTEGRLHICLSEADLPPAFAPLAPPVDVTAPTLKALRHQVRAATDALKFPLERSQDLETAVGEGAMNACVHAGGGVAQVCASPGDETLQVWVRDTGKGISEEALPRALEKGVSTAGTLGHGFWLMLRTCDRIYLLTGPTGTTLVLEQDCAPPEPVWLQSLSGLGVG